MELKIKQIFAFCVLLHQSVFSTPYWDSTQLPNESVYSHAPLSLPSIHTLKTVQNNDAVNVLRVRVDWEEQNESYTVANMIIEASGTQALLARSTHKPNLGSYLGILIDKQTGQPMYYDSIATGSEYRKLTRAITMRFPVPENDMIFELFAENPQTGVMEKVVSQDIVVNTLQESKKVSDGTEIKELTLSRNQNPLKVNIYAEGYSQLEKEIFWRDAMKTAQILQQQNFPGVEDMSFYAVFHASNKNIGPAKKLELPVPEFDSFLGLYYPYWDASSAFKRWYHVTYPTREEKFREGLAVAAYDYPLVLLNTNQYFGTGSYMTFVAIPTKDSHFTSLLLHETGHLFGLNEEYSDSGTELMFARGMSEPWSQNMTVSLSTNLKKVKWQSFVQSSTPLPTPDHFWKSSSPVYGAYSGGYGGFGGSGGTNQLQGRTNYRPGHACVMDTAPNLCDVCKQAIKEVISYSRGF